MAIKPTKLNRETIVRFLKTDQAILMLCISIAFAFWLMTKLSYSYKSQLRVNVIYKAPRKEVFTFPPPAFINVDVEGQGWDLLRHHMSFSTDEIELQVKTYEEKRISASALKQLISQKFKNLSVEHVFPEIIEIKTEALAARNIPIDFDYRISLPKLYKFVTPPALEPNFVQVQGPASLIKNMESWKTKSFIRENEKASYKTTIELLPHTNPNIIFIPNKVVAKVQIEEITEKTLSVPIRALNVPDSLLFVVLPDVITVRVQLGLSDYNAITAATFDAVIDFEALNLSSKEALPVKVYARSKKITQFTFTPKSVDYIVRTSLSE